MYKSIGHYLERDVLYKTISSLEHYLPISLSTSVVLLYFSSLNVSDEELERFLKLLIQASPLAMTICGVSADSSFNKLLQLLSKMPRKNHIMTYISKSEHCLDDFFLASWPAEKHYDDWKNYVIIEIGGSYIEESVNTYLNKPKV